VGGEGNGIGLTIPILRWEEKRPRMGRSAGAASFLALGGIVGGRWSAAMRPEEPGMARVFGGKRRVGACGCRSSGADEHGFAAAGLDWAGLGCEMGGGMSCCWVIFFFRPLLLHSVYCL
jgi:hypothetical protein